MSKTITVTVPDGYEDSTHIVLVAPTIEASPWSARSGQVVEWAATVLKVESTGPHDKYGNMQATEVVEEVGCGPLTGLMTDAARIVRTGTAAKASA